MKAPISKDRAESRVVAKYKKLYAPLIELVDALQDLEPGGTLVDDINIVKDSSDKVQVAYVAKPVMLTITDGNRIFILRVLPSDGIPD